MAALPEGEPVGGGQSTALTGPTMIAASATSTRHIAVLRAQAEQFRKLAEATTDRVIRDQALDLARRYDGLASQIGDHAAHAVQPPSKDGR